MRGEAERAAAGLAATPPGRLGDALDHVPQAARVDGMLVERLPIVGQLLDPQVGQRHLARRANELEPDVAGIGLLRLRDLVDERADRERLKDVVDRAQPADARVRGGVADFGGDVGHGECEVQHALLQIIVAWLGRPAEDA